MPFHAHNMSVYGVNNTKQMKNTQKVSFWVCQNEFLGFGNEFHGFGNEFPPFGGNEFRTKRTKKGPGKLEVGQSYQ